MIRKLLTYVAVFSIISFSALQVKASHLMGGTLTYKYMGKSGANFKYRITQKLYIDCYGSAGLDAKITISAFEQDSLNPNNPDKAKVTFNGGNFDLPKISEQQIAATKPTSNCNYTPNVSAFCIMEGIYQADIVLPPTSGGYHLLYVRCCRNAAIQNLDFPDKQGQTYYAFIPPTSITNSTPTFDLPPVPFFCLGSTANLYNTATDPDGDSLVYSLVQPYNADQSAQVDQMPTYTFPIPLVNYAAGCNQTDIFGTFGTSVINSQTGITQYFSSQQGKFVAAIEVSEYRNGKLISKIRRDIQLYVDPNCPAGYSSPHLDASTTTDTLKINEGDHVCLPLDFKDDNGDSLYVTYEGSILDSTILNPGPKITGPTKGLATLKSNLCWNTICGQGRTTPYSFRATVQDNGCPSFPKPIDLYILVKKPQPIITGPNIVCEGRSGSYSITGQTPASTFTWTVTGGTPSVGTGSVINVNWGALGTGTIKVTETNKNGCIGDPTVLDVNIRKVPVVTIAGPSTICSGDIAVLTASGGDVYNWTGGINTTGTTVSVTPTSDASYVIVASIGGCSSDPFNYNIKVNPLPVATTSVSIDNICPEIMTSTLTATGGVSYSWVKQSAPGVVIGTTASIVRSETSTTIYTVKVTDANGCSVNKDQTLNIRQYPPVSANASKIDICYGDTIALSATGAISYTWATGFSPSTVINSSPSFSIVPDQSKTYIATGTDAAGCQAKFNVPVTVRALPVVQVSSPKDSICIGSQAILTATGALTYQWNTTTNPVVFSTKDSIHQNPALTTYYIVQGSDAFGCKKKDTMMIYARQLPPVIASAIDSDICIGTSTVIMANGAKTYSWSDVSAPGVELSTLRNFQVSPTVSTFYRLTGTDQYGCIKSADVHVQVLSLPLIKAFEDTSTICDNSPVRLSARKGLTYTWVDTLNSGSVLNNDSVYNAFPHKRTTYKVTGTDVNGCVNTDTISVNVNPKPGIRNVVGTPYVCPGLQGAIYTIDTTFATSKYNWQMSGGSITSAMPNDSVVVNFNTTGSPVVSFVETNVFGCAGDPMLYPVQIKTVFNPVAPIGKAVLCSKDNANVIYKTKYNTVGSTYTWGIVGGTLNSANGLSQMSVTWNVIGSAKLWYTETSSFSANCGGTSDTTFVTINPTPVASSIIGDSILCKGANVQYNYKGNNPGSTYVWKITKGIISGGEGTKRVFGAWDTAGSGTVSVIETSAMGCPSTEVTDAITILDKPVISSVTPFPASTNTLICPTTRLGKEYTVTLAPGTPAASYKWNTINGKIVGADNQNKLKVDWDLPKGNMTYTITVQAFSAEGCMSNTFPLDFNYVDATAVMENVSCIPNQPSKILVNWKQSFVPGGSPSYKLIKRKMGAANWDSVSIPSNNLYEDINLQTNKFVYEYYYKTTDQCGVEESSKIHNSILLKATRNPSDDRVMFNFNTYKNWNNGLLRYELWRKLDGETEYTFYRNLNTDSAFEYNDAKDGFEHCFKTKAIENASNFSSWSNDTCIDFDHVINVPTAFSPNGDGVNDTWLIRNIEAYHQCELTVFNRWGDVVYSEKGYQNKWDGTVNGKELPDGTYFFVLKLNHSVNGQDKILNGNITIAR